MANQYPIDVFGEADSSDYWPRRLLHLPSMTSVERVGRDTYLLEPTRNFFKKPQYSVLSYTWGRYEKKPRRREHRRLEVAGIQWEIPPVKEEHFLVEDFQRALGVLASKHEFAWVDVACIHQEDNVLKLDEIGRQGKIFQRAESAYIWLCRTSSTSLKRISNQMESMKGLYLHAIQDDFFESKSPKPDLGKDMDKEEEDLLAMLDSSIQAISKLIEDPYFSSLWTLQESLYHQQACVISSDGKFHVEHPLGFGDIESTWPHLKSEKIGERIEGVMKLMRRAGYDPSAVHLYNPHRSRRGASYREASIEQDRIFAVMSVYGITTPVTPNTIDPYLYSLADLEHSFAAKLNTMSPALGQLFLHVNKPYPRCSWKVTSTADIIDQSQIWTTNWRRWKVGCGISATTNGYANFHGLTISLSQLLEVSEQTEVSIVLDKYLQGEFAIPPLSLLKAQGMLENEIFHCIGNLLLMKNADRIRLLELATVGSTKGNQMFIFLIMRRLLGVEHIYERLGICFLWPRCDIQRKREYGELH